MAQNLRIERFIFPSVGPSLHHCLEVPRLCSSLLQPAEQLRRVIGDDDVSACAAKHKDTAVRIARSKQVSR